jgi:hypothetical protein
VIRPQPHHGEPLTDYTTRLEAECATWRLFALLVLPWFSPAITATLLAVLPWPSLRFPWPGLPVVLAALTVASVIVARILAWFAWLLVDPNRPPRRGPA